MAVPPRPNRYFLQQLQSSWQQQGSCLQQHFGIRIAKVGFIVVPLYRCPDLATLHKLSQPLAAASARRRRVTCTLTADCYAGALKNTHLAQRVLLIREAGTWSDLCIGDRR